VPDTNPTPTFLHQLGDGSAPEKMTLPGERIEGAMLEQTRAALAYLITVGFFGFLLLLLFLSPPPSNLAMLNIVLGSLGTAWLGAMAYFFGASAKSSNEGHLRSVKDTVQR
jgi:hypothetical protein